MQAAELLDETVGDLDLEKPMTLQIGLSSPSGFVIASDKLVQIKHGETPMHSAMTDKIRVISQNGLAVASAGVDPPPQFVDDLSKRWGSEPPIEVLRHVAKSYVSPDPLARTTPQYEFIVGCSNGNEIWQVVIKGAGHNVAKYDKATTAMSFLLAAFVPEHFYSSDLPLSDLETIAALTIWYGERQGNTTVRGLGGVTCENGRIEEWSAEKIASLRKRCDSIHTKIRAAIVES
jgi:hypothetical protein